MFAKNPIKEIMMNPINNYEKREVNYIHGIWQKISNAGIHENQGTRNRIKREKEKKIKNKKVDFPLPHTARRNHLASYSKL